MEYNVREDAMRLVVKYLNIEDLKSASITCRSWLELIHEEIQIKGPKIVTQEIIINRYNKAIAKNDHVFFSTDIRPFLLLCFTNKDCNSAIAQRHISQLHPKNCYIAELKRNILEDVNTVWTILIPYSSHLEINTMNFAVKYETPMSGLRWIDIKEKGKFSYFHEYFQELDELSFRYKQLKLCSPIYQTFLILFCTYSDISDLKKIIAQLSIWYPQSGPIWGCILNSAGVFPKKLKKVPPPKQANIIQIYISGIEMLTKVLIFNDGCNTKEKIEKEFQDLKSAIQLKKCSIAFMCTSVARYKNFYEIESTAFKEIFPQVRLAHIFSRRPFGAQNFYEFNKYLRDIKPHLNYNDTTFLLFTYN